MTIISLSAMLGSGLFVLPAFAYNMMGPTVWLAYLLAASVVLPGALSKSELSTSMPTSGGTYVYIERTFGAWIGTVTGLGLWISFLLKSAFALIGFSAYFFTISSLLGFSFDIKYISVVLLFLMVFINILGVSKIKSIQTPILITSVGLLVGISVWALFTGDTNLTLPLQFDMSGAGLTSLAETSAFVFVAYAGVTKIAAVAEEVTDPGKNLPRGILLSLLISTCLYSFVLYAMSAVLEPSAFLNEAGVPKEDIVYVFARHIGGDGLGNFAAIIAILTMVSMSLAGIMAASRFPFAMARDNLLPTAMEDVHPKYETPHNTILLTGALMLLCILFLPVQKIAKLASGFKIMVFILINISVIILRQSKLTNVWHHPKYKSPLYPVFQIYGVVGGIALLFVMGKMAFIGASVAGIAGTVLYFSYGKKHYEAKHSPWTVLWKRMSKNSEADKILWRSVFVACDEAGKGHLILSEFIKAMNVLEKDIPEDDIRELWHNIDTNADGVIDIDACMAALHYTAQHTNETVKVDL